MLWPRWRGDAGFEKNPAEMQPSIVGPVSSLSLDQSRGIRSLERKLAGGPLTGRGQSDVYATIVRQQDRLHVTEQLLALLWSQLRVPLNLISNLGFVHILLLAQCFGFEVCGGNAVFDQEALGARDTASRERLIVIRGAA